MENPRYSCPVCRGHVLVEDLATPPGDHAGEAPDATLVTRKLYCPHCEMLVDPVITSAEEYEEQRLATRDAASENRGRVRVSGSNAGGSQRGDLSDEGATQWRTDPLETERNTWQDKP